MSPLYLIAEKSNWGSLHGRVEPLSEHISLLMILSEDGDLALIEFFILIEFGEFAPGLQAVLNSVDL